MLHCINMHSVRPTIKNSLTTVLLAAAIAPAAFADAPAFEKSIERWGMQEVAIRASREYRNPFTEVSFHCRFQSAGRTIESAGFYDGQHTWRCRLMPEIEGTWTFTTVSSDSDLTGKTGDFQVTRPVAGNHGPVSVRGTYHFAYADGTPFQPVGTTLYN